MNLKPLRVDELKVFLRLAKRWDLAVKLDPYGYYMTPADTAMLIKDIEEQIEERTPSAT